MISCIRIHSYFVVLIFLSCACNDLMAAWWNPIKILSRFYQIDMYVMWQIIQQTCQTHDTMRSLKCGESQTISTCWCLWWLMLLALTHGNVYWIIMNKSGFRWQHTVNVKWIQIQQIGINGIHFLCLVRLLIVIDKAKPNVSNPFLIVYCFLQNCFGNKDIIHFIIILINLFIPVVPLRRPVIMKSNRLHYYSTCNISNKTKYSTPKWVF